MKCCSKCGNDKLLNGIKYCLKCGANVEKENVKCCVNDKEENCVNKNVNENGNCLVKTRLSVELFEII